MSERKVLITDALHEYLIAGLSELDLVCDYQPGIDYDTCLKIIAEYTGLVVSSHLSVNQVLIDKGKKLEFIARAGSGMENIDVAYAESRNISCINSPEGNKDAVGEHAIGMLLSLLHNISKADKEIRENLWLREENRGMELQGKTIGILGFGNTGQALSSKLAGFEVRILAYDKYKSGFADTHVEESGMDGIFKEADVLSVHLPLTEETHHIINYQFTSKFKRPIYVLNTSRGKILNTVDLIRSMEENKILGAALDVFENEQIETLHENELKWYNYLIQSKRIILSPHIARWTIESKEKIVKVLVEKIKKLYL